MRIIDRLIKILRDAAIFNPDVQTAPACILWPDRDRQWEAVIPRLHMEMPELLVLGDYAPEKRIGPAIWLRCVLAGKADEVSIPHDRIPIIYLPGISRQDLRAVETCPEPLKPLAELQFRGVIWSQINAKDWTILAFLKSDQGGLGLDAAQDNDAKNAMQLALYRLLDEEVELLKGKRLDKDYFNTLMTGGDPVRDVLQWLDQGDVFQQGREEHEWKAFVEVCKSQMAFHPQKQGLLTGAARLAGREGPWKAVWERFCEAPRRYPNIPSRIRQCPMPDKDLFSDAASHGSWPQWNDGAEKSLQNDINALNHLPPHEARKKIADLEKKHGDRRHLIWAALGESPLACALEALAVLADITAHSIAAGSIADMVAAYRNAGWQADAAAMKALSYVSRQEDLEAVSAAIQCMYLPWIEESARYLQKLSDQQGYPGGSIKENPGYKAEDGLCILFVDGLRFDAAKQLESLLAESGCRIEEHTAWAALPSVTATGKPAAAPAKDKIYGHDVTADFEPCVRESGQSLKGGYHLNKLLTEAGWGLPETPDDKTSRHAWCEYGNIDHEGHARGWKLARHLDGLLCEIRDKILQLLAVGYKAIRVVTDHGWILMPGGLPKIDLPAVLTDNKWGRCAVIKAGAKAKTRLYPWYWNPNQYVAVADGVSCFRKGLEYAHGGLSLQECLLLELTVSPGALITGPVSVEKGAMALLKAIMD